MTEMNQHQVYVQGQSTRQELIADGFAYYPPVKRVTMMRIAPPDETLEICEPRYWIAYVAGEALTEIGEDYQSRLIKLDTFSKMYRVWDKINWKPSSTEAHLLNLDCQPYYKVVGVWAKLLNKATWIRNTNRDEISLAQKGMWLSVSMEGKLWATSETTFFAHYRLPRKNHRKVK